MITRSTSRKALCALGCVSTLALAACGGGAYKGQTMFTLDGGAPVQAPDDVKPHPGILRMRAVSVAEPYSSQQFIYRYADGRVRSDSYASYIAAPEALLGATAIERLGRDRVFDQVVGQQMGLLQAYELALAFGELGCTFDDKGGTARVHGTAYLLDPTAQPVVILASFPIQTAAPVNGEGVNAVAAATNAALGEWFSKLASELRSSQVPELTAQVAAAKGRAK